MKKNLSITSFIAATIGAAYFSENLIVLPAIGCIVYMVVWGYAQTKAKPRAATPGKRGKTSYQTKILNFYDSTVRFGTQMKFKTPAGTLVMPVHYEE